MAKQLRSSQSARCHNDSPGHNFRKEREPKLKFLPVIAIHKAHNLWKFWSWVTYPSRWNMESKMSTEKSQMWFFWVLDACYNDTSMYQLILILILCSLGVLLQHCKIKIATILVQIENNGQSKWPTSHFVVILITYIIVSYILIKMIYGFSQSAQKTEQTL